MLPFAPAVSVRTAIEAVVACALAGALLVQGGRLNAARSEARTLVAQVSQLQADIDAQNLGIAMVKAETEKRAQASAVATKTAQKALARAEARAARLEAAPVPQTCTEAIDFLVRDAAETQ